MRPDVSVAETLFHQIGEVCHVGGTDLGGGDIGICTPLFPAYCAVPNAGDTEGYCLPACDDMAADTTTPEKFEAYGWKQNTSSTMLGYCGDGADNVIVPIIRCVGGSYGPVLIGNTTSCSPCPDGGAAFVGKNTKKTDCFLPSGRTYSDEGGTFVLTGDCYYVE